MHPEEQIEALAELDGWTVIHHEGKTACHEEQFTGDKEGSMSVFIPNYLTSYNAIIPLIQKQWKSTNTDEGVRWQFLFWNALMDSECMLFNSPAQLCEALLRALGKWKD